MVNKLKFTPGNTEAASAAPAMDMSQLTSMKNLRCPHCANQVFQQLFIAKKISAIESQSGKAGIAPMQIFACTNCGAVPKEFGGGLLEQDEAPTDQENKTDKIKQI